jgi:hypothetical protein
MRLTNAAANELRGPHIAANIATSAPAAAVIYVVKTLM